MNKNDLVWTEKYRPGTIADTILPERIKTNVREFLTTGNIPNFIFTGSAGVGKTTLARAICNELGADYLFVNGSNESGIDTLRTKIQQFASTVSLTDSKKVVIIDEADYLNANSTQPAFRAFLEEFTGTSFIFTCNYKTKIIDPLRSRLTEVEFKVSKDEKMKMSAQMFKRVCEILDTEKVTFDKKAVAALVTKFFPDFRKTVAELQRYSVSGTIDSGVLINLEEANTKELFDAIKAKQFGKARQWVANSSIDPTSFFREFYDNSNDLLQPQSIPQLILLIGEYQHRAAHSVDQEINAMAFIVEVMQSCLFKD